MPEHTEVVVIGGGYAGAVAANRLTQRDDVAGPLINPHPTCVERLRLHQPVGGSHQRSSTTERSGRFRRPRSD